MDNRESIKQYNIYLHNIQRLLNHYSIREILVMYRLSMRDIRLASEIRNIHYNDNISPQCVWEIRSMDDSPRRRWLRYIERTNCDASQLRKVIRESKRMNEPVKWINISLRERWLAQRQHLIESRLMSSKSN